MTTIPQNISIETLYESFCTVITKPQTILNDHLEPIPGRLSSSSHDKIFSIIIQILEHTTADEIPSQVLLIKLRDIIHAYIAKVETTSKLSIKAGRRPTSISQEKAQRIFERIKQLHSQVCLRKSPRSDSPRTIESAEIRTEADFLKLRGILCGMVTEWYFFKALELSSSMLSVMRRHRTELFAMQYRLSINDDGIVMLPPLSHFEAPWPIMLLGIRFEKFASEKPTQSADFQLLIHRIVKAKEFYPQYNTILSGLLVSANYAEAQRTWAVMMQECAKTLSMIRERIPKDSLGASFPFLFQQFDLLRPGIAATNKSRDAFLALSFPSKDARFDAGEQIEKMGSAVQEGISSIFSQGVAAFKETLTDFAHFYTTILSKLRKYEEETASNHGRPHHEALLTFTPVIPSPLFSPSSLFSSYIPNRFLTDAEIHQFTPLTYSTRIDNIIRQLQTEKSESTSEPKNQRSEFLPKNIFTPPQPKPALSGNSKHQPQPHSHLRPSLDDTPPAAPSSPPFSPPAPPIPSPISPPSLSITSLDPPTEEIAQLSLQDVPPPSPFSFCIHDGPNPNQEFAFRVRRWKDPRFDPFRCDARYREKNYSQPVQESIRFQHTPPLALTHVILDYGEKYIHADKIRESYYLPAEATWYDGTGRYEKGVITVGRNRLNGEIFHYTFSQQAPSTLRQNYAHNQFFPCHEEEEPIELPAERIDPRKTQPDDGSFIRHIDDQDIGIVTVTVDDPQRKVLVAVFFDR